MTNPSREFKLRTFRIDTLGCRVNQYESDALAAELAARGWRPAQAGERPDLQILNTCTVTAEAGRKVRQHLRRMRKAAPEAFLVAWGCHVEFAERLPDCDLLLGNRAKAEAADRILRHFQASGDPGPERPFALRELPIEVELRGVESERRFSEFPETPQPQESRAYVKVQDGCDNYCTYCAIRLVRGRSRSRPVDAVVEEVRALVAAGYAEIQLSGIHLSAYGRDLPRAVDLGDLLLALDAIAGVERLRLGSLEPEIIRDEVLEKFAAASSFAPHLHLALQSGSARILRRMGRRYTKAEYEAAVRRIRRDLPDCELSTDLMVGFPGETPEEHRESLEFVEAVAFADLHIFRYSPRPGTAAVRFGDDVPQTVKKTRAEEAEALRRRLHRRALERQLGRTERIMAETLDPVRGYTGTYLPCTLIRDERIGSEHIGRMIPVRLTKIDTDGLKGVTLW